MEPETFELWPVFDAFVKVVARRANTRYFHRRKATANHVTWTDHVIVCALLDKKSVRDGDCFETLYVHQNGQRYPLSDPRLHDALQQLPEESLQILILKFWYECREDEIARRLKMSIRSCYTKRKRALEQLRKIMEEEESEKT